MLQENAPRDARLPKRDDFSCRNPGRREGHGPPSSTPGQGELCPPRDAQAESGGKIPSFSNPHGKAECCLLQEPRRLLLNARLLNVKSFPQENDAGRVVGSFFQGE